MPMRRAVAVLLFSIAAAPLHAANFVDSKYELRIARNLAYGADREQRLDLYEPTGSLSPKVRPAFIG